MALSAAAIATGCHADPVAPPFAAPLPHTPEPGATAPRGSVEPGADVPSLESLAAMADRVAPGMRVIARGQGSVPASIPLPAIDADTCVRAVFGAASPVIAALVTDAGSTVAMTYAGALALLEARGPICLRRGPPAHLEVQGRAPFVRYVVWMTP